MDDSIRQYLATIGQRGGEKSRRNLSREEAQTMVRIREARRAYKKFYAKCFWSYDPNLQIGIGDIAWVAERLMKLGNREAWHIGAALLSSPNSNRFSQDLDYFHDSALRVATAFAADQSVLQAADFGVETDLSQPGMKVVI